jgi:hypothetical protein
MHDGYMSLRLRSMFETPPLPVRRSIMVHASRARDGSVRRNRTKFATSAVRPADHFIPNCGCAHNGCVPVHLNAKHQPLMHAAPAVGCHVCIELPLLYINSQWHYSYVVAASSQGCYAYGRRASSEYDNQSRNRDIIFEVHRLNRVSVRSGETGCAGGLFLLLVQGGRIMCVQGSQKCSEA